MKNKGERRENLTVASFGLESRAEIRPSVTCQDACMANWENCIRQYVAGREHRRSSPLGPSSSEDRESPGRGNREMLKMKEPASEAVVDNYRIKNKSPFPS